MNQLRCGLSPRFGATAFRKAFYHEGANLYGYRLPKALGTPECNFFQFPTFFNNLK